jgi:hypothetical protein
LNSVCSLSIYSSFSTPLKSLLKIKNNLTER